MWDLAVLDIIFGAIEEYLAPNAKLSQYQQQLLCLIRLGMNYLLKDLAYQVHVFVATVQNAFQCILDVLYSKISILIRWFEHDLLPFDFRVIYILYIYIYIYTLLKRIKGTHVENGISGIP